MATHYILLCWHTVDHILNTFTHTETHIHTHIYILPSPSFRQCHQKVLFIFIQIFVCFRLKYAEMQMHCIGE